MPYIYENDQVSWRCPKCGKIFAPDHVMYASYPDGKTVCPDCRFTEEDTVTVTRGSGAGGDCGACARRRLEKRRKDQKVAAASLAVFAIGFFCVGFFLNFTFTLVLALIMMLGIGAAAARLDYKY